MKLNKTKDKLGKNPEQMKGYSKMRLYKIYIPSVELSLFANLIFANAAKVV